MISTNLSSMLNNLGWGSGFRLPVANEENKALEEMLEQKQKYLLEISGTLETDSQHCQILESHFERIKNAVDQSQKMISAKRSGIETEQNLKSLAERLESRVKDDFTKALSNIKEYNERNRRMTEEVEARKAVIEDLINTVKFDQVALEKYKQVTQDKENYIKFMKTLNHLDERSSQEFQLKFGKIGEELSISRKTLNEYSMHTQTLQQQFGRLCNQFRRVHLERSQAINFWESTLKSMKKRDEDIKDVAEEYTEVRTRVNQVESQCDRNRSMLTTEKQNALHLEYQIKNSDKNCGSYRLKLSESKEHTLSLGDEILIYNTIINTTSRAVKDIQNKIQKHDTELSLMQQKLEKAQAELAATKARYDSTLVETMSEESRTKEIERMIDQEEQRTELLLADIEKQRRHMWQRSNDCSLLTEKLKSVVGKIKGTKTMCTSLKDRAKFEDIKVQKKRQMAYHLELECLSMESRIQHLVASQVDAAHSPAGPSRESVLLIKEKLLEVTKTRAFLTGQESHMKNVNTRIQRDINTVLQEHVSLKQMIENEKVEAKRCGLENKKAVTDLQNLQVENRLLEMTLGRLNKVMQQEKNKMFSLEQERIMMEAAAQERRSEIDLHLGILKVQQRNLKDERSKIHGYILEMLQEVERYKTRYEFIINALNTPGEEPGQSESYYILKHAQERETLKREGDLWDEKVKEAETEIAALQNTLSVLVSSNMAFKESLQPAAEETPEAKMLLELENGQKFIMVRKRKADKQKAEMASKIVAHQAETSGTTHQKMYLEGLLGEKKYELNNVHFEVANQKSKIDRANRMSSRLIKELGLHVHEDREAIEMDLKLRCAREKFEFALKTLEKTIFQHQDIRATTLNFLASTELEPLINRLKKRISVTDGSMSPYHSRSSPGTPTRYLTPIPSSYPSHPRPGGSTDEAETKMEDGVTAGAGQKKPHSAGRSVSASSKTKPMPPPILTSKPEASNTLDVVKISESDDKSTVLSSFDATTLFKLDSRTAESLSAMFLEEADSQSERSEAAAEGDQHLEGDYGEHEMMSFEESEMTEGSEKEDASEIDGTEQKEDGEGDGDGNILGQITEEEEEET